MLLEPHEYIDVLGFNFKHQLAHYGGLYLISTEDLWKRGICKVGIASHFGRRMKTFRSCFGFFTKLYLFGLIVIDVENAKERNKIEKQILAAFNELRLPYPDTENNTEWLREEVARFTEQNGSLSSLTLSRLFLISRETTRRSAE